MRLTIRRGRRKPRHIQVDALGSEELLRYRDWVEQNRASVHAETGDQAELDRITFEEAVGHDLGMGR